MDIFCQIKEALSETLFPSDGRCTFCRKLLLFEPQPFCYPCLEKIPWIGARTCKKCGKEEVVTDTLLCHDCFHTPHQYQQGLSLFTYIGEGKRIVQEIKFERNKKLGLWVGKQMGKKIQVAHWKDSLDMIVPIPLHPNRLQERGFNQSEELAKGIKDILDIPLETKPLLRTKDTPHQTDLSKEQRQENIKSAFQVENPEMLRGKTILLVDDVYTTGSTIDACAEALKDAGAKEVYFSVAATGKGMVRSPV